MAITPIQNVWFDDAATFAMGEAFDNGCKSLQNFGSAVPEIIAYLIIQAAKTGERDPARLYEQALNTFSIEDMSMPVVSVGSDLPVPAYFGHARSVMAISFYFKLSVRCPLLGLANIRVAPINVRYIGALVSRHVFQHQLH